eukprot:g447.t1
MVSVKSPDAMASDDLRMPNIWNLGTIFTFYLLSTTSFTIVFTTAEQYAMSLGVASPLFAGVIIGIVPVVASLSSPFWKYTSQTYGTKKSLYLLGLISLIGNFLYAIASAAQAGWLLIVARAVVGFASASQVISEYIGMTCGKRRKTQIAAYLLASVNVGFAIGPAIAFLISVLDAKVKWNNVIVDGLTMPGWVMVFLFSMFLVMVVFCFEDVDKTVRAKFHKRQALALIKPTDLDEVSTKTQRSNSKTEVSTKTQMSDWDIWRTRLPTVCFTLYSVFTLGFCCGGTEARTGIYSQRAWGWSITMSSLYLALTFGSLAPAVFFFGKILMNVQDRKILRSSLIVGALGSILLFPFTKTQTGSSHLSEITLWTIGMVIVTLALCVARGSMYGLTIKTLPSHLLADLIIINNFVYFGGRGFGAILGTYLDASVQSQLIFASLQTVLLTGNALYAVMGYHRLVSWDEKKETVNICNKFKKIFTDF